MMPEFRRGRPSEEPLEPIEVWEFARRGCATGSASSPPKGGRRSCWERLPGEDMLAVLLPGAEEGRPFR